MEELNALNEVQEDVVDSQTEVIEVEQQEVTTDEPNVIEDTGEKVEEVAEPQSKEDNAQFANIRRKAEADARKAYEAKMAKMQSLTGMDFDATLDYLEQEKLKQEAQVFAEQNQVSEEFARQQVEQNNELQQLKKEVAMSKALASYEVEKAALKDKPFFSELESEIETLVKSEASQGKSINAQTAYKFLVGENLDRLLATTQQSTIASVQDKMKRGLPISDSDSSESGGKVQINQRMANIFGNDPKEIMAYKKKHLK